MIEKWLFDQKKHYSSGYACTVCGRHPSVATYNVGLPMPLSAMYCQNCTDECAEPDWVLLAYYESCIEGLGDQEKAKAHAVKEFRHRELTRFVDGEYLSAETVFERTGPINLTPLTN